MNDVLVCATLTDPLLMHDNLTGNCDGCDVDIQYRPHAPDITRLCFRCVAIAVAAATDQIEVVITKETEAELRERGIIP